MDLRTVIRDRRHASLVHGARRGDRKAFRALFDDLHDPVHAYLDRRCDDPHDTEDLVSTVFHKMLSNLGTFDPGRGSVIGWVMTMARHALIDHLRRRRDTVDVDRLAEVLAGPGADPLQGIIRTEEAERVRAELARLPAETRELLALRYGEGLRHAEIASLLGLTDAAVRQRLSRAVQALRSRVVDDPEPEGEVDYAIR
ncbi:MAG TPA: sigma-70 family RNA polymerase sigma factor [Candidatus Krumholzibacteria bacterium]|nr:sigma-70 family RNA polymerase sigma factor [Candidatus Krumholzibacteria bacterium]